MDWTIFWTIFWTILRTIFLDHFIGGKHTISTQGGVGMQSTSTEGGMEGRVLLLREG